MLNIVYLLNDMLNVVCLLNDMLNAVYLLNDYSLATKVDADRRRFRRS